MIEDNRLQKAASLAKWLIEDQGVKKPGAYFIAKHKYQVEKWQEVRSAYQDIKRKQLRLI